MLEVNNYQETRTIYNVIASIYGAVEPGKFHKIESLLYVRTLWNYLSTQALQNLFISVKNV